MVDNDVLRLNEAKQVHETLNRDLGVNLTVVDASDLFFARLAGVEDSEQKRRIIGNTFINYTLSVMVVLPQLPVLTISGEEALCQMTSLNLHSPPP